MINEKDFYLEARLLMNSNKNFSSLKNIKDFKKLCPNLLCLSMAMIFVSPWMAPIPKPLWHSQCGFPEWCLFSWFKDRIRGQFCAWLTRPSIQHQTVFFFQILFYCPNITSIWPPNSLMTKISTVYFISLESIAFIQIFITLILTHG